MVEKEGKKKQMTSREIQLALIDNFVNMQKVLTNLSVKFDVLSDNISRLLQLFEIAAKSFVKKQEENGFSKEDRALVEKLDVLLDQNKTIAKGLTLVEEKIRHKIYPEESLLKPRLNLEKQEQTNRMPVQEKTRPRPLPRI
ncbi:hypothetical protein FJZ17_01595 [Candidatus Pacearchaeota archaeon]|nr:hypothetical protein [Candidatus Pacearchaeota archaeon]